MADSRIEFTWDPAQHHEFGSLRQRAAIDLLARVAHPGPELIYDVGTGRGEMARLMAGRWPRAKIVGTDSSGDMLAVAAATPSRVAWQLEDVRDWDPPEPLDIIFSNAVLNWVENHDRLIMRLVDSLRPGGVLAIQMPLSWSEPSHRLVREVLETDGAEGRPLGPAALRARLGRRPVAGPTHYHRLLAAHVATLDIWTTRYWQVLEGPDPVYEWVKGTALRPVLAELEGGDLERFRSRYRRELRTAYPAEADGTTLYPFPRLFIVAVKT